MSTLRFYLLYRYLKTILISLTASISLLVVSRLEVLAELGAIGATSPLLFKYFLTLFPLFLSIALPLSSLLSAFLLASSLSKSGELLALRSGGVPLRTLLGPLLWCSLFFSCGCLYITSEWSTKAHTLGRLAQQEMIQTNPLEVLKRVGFKPIDGAIVKFGGLGPLEADLVVCALNSQRNSSFFLVSETLVNTPTTIEGADSLILATYSDESGKQQLLVETLDSHSSRLDELLAAFKTRSSKVKGDYLPLAQLRLLEKKLKKCFIEEENKDHKCLYAKRLAQCRSEYFRRLCLGFLTFTLTLFGFSRGISQEKRFPARNYVLVIMGAFICFVAYFLGHQIEHYTWASASIYIFPQLLMILWAIWALFRRERAY